MLLKIHRACRRMKILRARLGIILLVGCLLTALLVSFIYLGYHNTWLNIGIPAYNGYFLDTKVITHGSESFSQGLDPLITNPADPFGRPMNYPRIWQGLFAFGLNKDHTLAMGAGAALAFFSGVIIVFPNANNKILALCLASLSSPAVLLGIERGNIDFYIFFVLAIAVAIVSIRPIVANGLILFTTVLKLYPIFAISMLLGLPRSLCKWHILCLTGLASLYLAITWRDIMLISATTPRETYMSYGVNVAWMRLAEISPELGFSVRVVSWILVLMVVVVAFLLLQWRSTDPIDEESINVISFRVGATIFCGSFLIGNNWDYRLIFLLFVIPQLSNWAFESNSFVLKNAAKTALACMLLSQWHLWIEKTWRSYFSAYAIHAPESINFPWAIDEIANWSLFFLLMVLLTQNLRRQIGAIHLHFSKRFKFSGAGDSERGFDYCSNTDS